MKYPPSVKYAQVVWKAVTQPNRWAILELMNKMPDEVRPKVIEKRLKLRQSLVSNHMRILMGVGLVTEKGKRGAWLTDPPRYTLDRKRYNTITEAINLLVTA